MLSDGMQTPGETAEVWEVTLAASDPDATEQVLGEKEFNEIPEGRAAVMVPVTVTYVGSQSGTPWTDLLFQFVGSDGNTYGLGSDDYCGVIPNDLADHGEMFPDATVTGNVCLTVPADVIDGGAWMVENTLAWEESRVFVSVD